MSVGDDPETNPRVTRRPVAMLAVGAVAGLVLAASGLLRTAGPEGGALPVEVAARVNQAVILRADFERLVAGLESDTRAAIDDAARRRVLERMIDEELLVQRGLELGLAVRDRRIRGELTAAVIRAVVVEAEEHQPTRDELESFFREQSAFFTQPGRLRVEQIFFRVRRPDEDAGAAARSARALLRLRTGDDFETVRREDGDPVISPLPNALLPATKLREYIGPTASQAAQRAQVGVPSEPVRSGVGYHVLRVLERESTRTPAFAELEPQIRAEWRRRAGDVALRAYLDELRSRASIAMEPNAP